MVHAFLFSILLLFFPIQAWADCSNPAGVEAEMVYNDDYDVMMFCNGVDWIGLGQGVDITASLASLTDTNVAPTDGQVLTWDNANSEWIAADAAGGGWQVPDDAAVCDGSTDGTIRYNSNKLHLCVNGTGWIDIGGSGVTNGKFVDGTNTNDAVYTTGNVGIGKTNPGALLDVAGDIYAQQICDESGANCKDISAGWGDENEFFAQPLLSYTTVNAACSSGRVISVSRTFFGGGTKTGQDICAADTASDGAKTTCVDVNYFYIRNNGAAGHYAGWGGDGDCNNPLPHAWPWGAHGSAPNSRPDEWQRSTYGVCCN